MLTQVKDVEEDDCDSAHGIIVDQESRKLSLVEVGQGKKIVTTCTAERCEGEKAGLYSRKPFM
jgi:hypothetical protein